MKDNNMDFEEFCHLIKEYKQRYPKLFELEADKTVDDHCISVVEKEYGLSFPDSYKNILKHIGGGYFGYIVIFSLDRNGLHDLTKHVSSQMIRERSILPVVNLETGDYIGYEIKDNVCTENLLLWNHDGDIKNYIEKNIYEVIITCGLKNEPL